MSFLNFYNLLGRAQTFYDFNASIAPIIDVANRQNYHFWEVVCMGELGSLLR